MTTDHDDTASSATDHAIAELQLHGYRPFQDEPDPRPLPEGRLIGGAIADIFDALIVSLRHQARARSRRSPVVNGPFVSPRDRTHRTRTRQQRTGATAQSARAGRLRNPIPRARTAHRPRPDVDRT